MDASGPCAAVHENNKVVCTAKKRKGHRSKLLRVGSHRLNMLYEQLGAFDPAREIQDNDFLVV